MKESYDTMLYLLHLGNLHTIIYSAYSKARHIDDDDNNNNDRLIARHRLA